MQERLLNSIGTGVMLLCLLILGSTGDHSYFFTPNWVVST